MKSEHKVACIYALALIITISMAIQFASASEYDAQQYSATTLTEEELDNVLAPIALYPDTLLTHVLIASTYPMDVIRAARWRESNAHLTAEQIRTRVDVFDWDPSVKALAPFDKVLAQMSEDIDWLNYLGDAVIADEEWVMSRIQVLREYAYEQGSLDSNEYVNVARDDNVVVIETVKDRVVYVPYYDTRVVFGPWWHARSPYYWHHPRNYYYRAGFYWSPSIHIASHFFFGGFHWHHGYVVVNYHNHRPYYRNYKRVYSREYQRWSHNVGHRKSRYHQRVIRHHNQRYSTHNKVVRTHERRKANVNYGQYQTSKRLDLSRQSHVAKRQARVEQRLTQHQPNAVKRHNTAPRKVETSKPRRDVIKPSQVKRSADVIKRSTDASKQRDIQRQAQQRAKQPVKRTQIDRQKQLQREVRKVPQQRQSKPAQRPVKRSVVPRQQARQKTNLQRPVKRDAAPRKVENVRRNTVKQPQRSASRSVKQQAPQRSTNRTKQAQRNK